MKINEQSTKHQWKIHEKSIKIHPKSIQNRRWAADALLEQTGVAPGMKKVIPWSEMGAVLVTIFDQKSKKSPQGGPKGTKSPDKGHQKVYAKIYTEKATKSTAKSYQHMLKRMPKSLFFDKKWMHESMWKSMPKQAWKLMEIRCENDTEFHWTNRICWYFQNWIQAFWKRWMC